VNARQYNQTVHTAINLSPLVIAVDLSFSEIDVNECYIRGVLTLINGFELHLAEYVITEPTIQRPKYRYHLQRNDRALVVRWDNAPHHRQVETFPDHHHDASGQVHSSPPIDIPVVLKAIVPYVFPLVG
jgi:hypothetical protein